MQITVPRVLSYKPPLPTSRTARRFPRSLTWRAGSGSARDDDPVRAMCRGPEFCKWCGRWYHKLARSLKCAGQDAHCCGPPSPGERVPVTYGSTATRPGSSLCSSLRACGTSAGPGPGVRRVPPGRGGAASRQAARGAR